MAQDILGREFNGVVQIGDLFGPVHTVVETKSPATEDKLDNLYSAINDVAARIDAAAAQELQAAKEYSQKVLQLRDSLAAARSAPAGGGAKLKSDGDVIRYLKVTAGSMNALYKAATKASTIYVGITGFTPRGASSLKRILQSCGLCGGAKAALSGRRRGVDAGDVALKAIKKKAAGGGGGTGGGSTVGDDSDGGAMGSLFGPGGAKGWAASWIKDLGALIPMVAKWSLEITNLSPMNIIPSAKDLNAAREQVRQIVFQTRGFGDTNREMEKVYRDVGDEASRAGVTMEVYQKIWLKNLERGTHQLSEQDVIHERASNFYEDIARKEGKALKTHLKSSRMEDLRVVRMKQVTTSALHAANRLGMDAEAVNDTFMNWHQQLGLSAGSMERLGSHMFSIARNTGVTGQRLQTAMKSVESLANQMKKIGTFSEGAARDMMEMSALAEKYGATDIWNQIMSGTMSLEDWQKMDPKLQSMIARSARQAGLDIQMIWSGGLKDKANFNKMMGGLEQSTMNIVESRFGDMIRQAGRRQGVEIGKLKMSELEEYQKLLGDQGFVLENVMKQIGASTGELTRLGKMHEESSKTFEQRISDMDADIAELEKIEGFSKLPEYQELKRRRLETIGKKDLDMVSAMSQAQRESGVKQANLIEEMRKQYGAEAVDSFDMGAALDRAAQNLRERGEFTGKNVDEMLASGKYGDMFSSFDDLKKSVMRGGKEAELAMSRFTQLQKDIELSESKAQDPVTQARQEQLELHNKFAKKLDEVLDVMTAYIGKYWEIIAVLTVLGVALTTFKGLLSFGKAVWGRMGGGGSPIPGGGTGPIPGGGSARGTPPVPMPPAGGAPTVPPTMPIPPASRGATVAPGGPDYGGAGWAGGRAGKSGVTPKTRAWELPTAGMSRRDRIANAERYLAARKAAGQSGRTPIRGGGLFKTPATGRFGRGTRLGRGLGMLSRVGGFLNRNRDKVATAAGMAGGAYLGYEAAPEGHGLTGALMGGAAGGALGYGAGRMMGKGGLQPGILPDLAANLAGAGGDMSQFPGWGQNCVPVCIVGGLENLAGGGGALGLMGAGAAAGLMPEGGGIADKAMDALMLADTAHDAVDLTKGAGQLANKTKVGSSILGKAGNALKTGWGKVAGAGSRVLGGGRLASAGSGLMSGGSKALGTVAKAAGPAAAVLTPLIGGILGAQEAEMYGRTKTEGAVLGALTGGAGTGSMFSGMLGVEKGSTGDEALGIAGAAGTGALTGAAIGSVIPVVGTAVGAGVGAVVGAGAELYKLVTDENSKIGGAIRSFGSTVWEGTKSVGSWIGEKASSIGGSIWDGVKGIGSWISGNSGTIAAAATGPVGLIGKGIYDNWNSIQKGFTSVTSTVGEWASSAWSGISGAWGGLTETVSGWASNAVGTLSTAWTGLTSGLSKIGSSIKDTVASAISDPAGTAASIAVGAVDKAKSIVSGIGDQLAKLWPFQEGTPSITKSGAAIVHEGETILPKSLSIPAAEGEKGGFSTIFNKIAAAAMGPVGMIATGMFDQFKQPLATLGEAVLTPIRKIFGLGGIERSAASSMEARMAAKESMASFYEAGAFDRASTIDEAMRGQQELLRLQEAVDAKKAAQGSAAEPNPLDYAEETQGIVSPVVNYPSVEESLERRQYTDHPGYSTPSMDDVSAYLNDIQARKLDTMIHYLRSIDSRLSQTAERSGPVGRRGASAPYSSGQGVKNIAVDLVSGQWDLTQSHYSPSAVTSEGRGGAD